MRAISSAEASLLKFLCGIAERVDLPDNLEGVMVQSLGDGGMGSSQLVAEVPPDCQSSTHKEMVSTAQSFDSDGGLVLATLFVNREHIPCEIDIWKLDFTSIKSFPVNWDVADIPRLPGSGQM